MDPAEEATQDDEPRIEDVDQSRQAEPEPPAGRGERRNGRGIAVGRGPHDAVDGTAAARAGQGGATQDGAFADLGLPAPGGPASAAGAVRVYRHVADLAGIPIGTAQRASVDDDAAADAHLAGDVEHVLVVARDSPTML